eukprot:TRINITY_DN29815_c0_g1_i1.p1 TRINITY_DN29815_c0_g1~~TRINITY_DN29815_c0_g1_i1.p1  ORF type:complete len:468 (-),score=71.26 TRINITY_DN29815_c0_g1_i1:464-1867(-)
MVSQASLSGVQCGDVTTSSMTPGVSERRLVLNLIAGGLGTGMLSLPWSMAGASVVPGVAMTIAIVGVNAWTISIIVAAAERHQVFDLGSLMGKLDGQIFPGSLGRRLPSLGNFMQCFTNFMVWVVLMGSLISYLIVMHDNTEQFLAGTFLDHGRVPLVTCAALIVLPLCFLDQSYLAFTSAIALLVNVYVIIVLIIIFLSRSANNKLPDNACYVGFGIGSPAMLAALSQCVIIQMCVLPMYEELEDRSPAKFNRALWLAFAVLMVIYSAFATLGYLVFGQFVHSDVLQDMNIPRTPYGDLAQLGMVLVVAAIYPIMVIPMVAPIKNMNLAAVQARDVPLRGADAEAPAIRGDGAAFAAIARRRWSLSAAAIVVIVAISYLGALALHTLGFVNVVDGALSVGAFTALAPSLVGLRLLEPASSTRRATFLVLVLVGIAVALLGIYLPSNYNDALVCHLPEQLPHGTTVV